MLRFQPSSGTAVTTTVAGTLIYMPPEYKRGGVVTEKNDVFSFGVVSIAWWWVSLVCTCSKKCEGERAPGMRLIIIGDPERRKRRKERGREGERERGREGDRDRGLRFRLLCLPESQYYPSVSPRLDCI